MALIPRAFLIQPEDSVAVLLEDVESGPVRLFGMPGDALLTAGEAIRLGHKIAVRSHEAGEAVAKFGVRIGHAAGPIAAGDWVHLHNCASDLDTRSNTLEVITGASMDTIYE